MMRGRRGFGWAAWVGLAVGAGAQAPVVAPVGPTGTVVGLVTASDTQRPARFAQVALMVKQMPEAGPVDRRRGAKEEPSVVLMMKATTGTDGRYSIAEVPVGDYYAIGMMEGYRLPGAAVKSEAEAKDMEKVMAGFPLVHVAAHVTTVANVVMQRGAGVSGRVMFDDGSPGVGFHVSLEPAEGMDALHISQRYGLLLSTLGSGFGGLKSEAAVTNDRGEFRIAGVAPGKYRVKTMMTVGGAMKFVGSANSVSGTGTQDQQNLTIYAPGKFHKDEAQVVEVRGDEEDGGIDVGVSLNATHMVSGTVLAKEDRHAPKHGSVMLADVKDKDFYLYAEMNGDGEYHFSFVPEGTYTLDVHGAYDGDEPRTAEEARIFKPSAMYAERKVNVMVGEHDVVVGEMLLDKVKKGEGPEEQGLGNRD